MKTLRQLCEIAKQTDISAMRPFLLILPNARPLNGRFLDPFMGLVELNDLPGKCVHISDLSPDETTGIFTDTGDN